MRKELQLIAKFRRGSLVIDGKGRHFIRLPFKGMYPVTVQRDGLLWVITDSDGKRVTLSWLNGARA